MRLRAVSSIVLSRRICDMRSQRKMRFGLDGASSSPILLILGHGRFLGTRPGRPALSVQSTLRTDRAVMFAADPFTFVAMKFPAPVCDDCAIPMVTATTIFHQKATTTPKVTFYQCQRCGCTLGAPLGRQYRIIPPAA